MTKLTQAEIKQAFHMEPEEIVKYFESKGLKTSFDWHEVYAEAHAKAFTVAKMTNVDLLKDTQGLLTKAIKEGWSEGHFKREASILFNKKGWTGLKEVTDPKTGETKTVELGTPRRIRTIFESNMRSANAAGRYKQQLEDADIAPYLQYMCTMDNKTRPEHAAMNEKVFRYDDPIWQSIYPPNGWGCRCFVRSLSEGELRRSGLKCESSEGHLRQVTDIVGGVERENTAYDFKVGTKTFTLKPDAGWGTNNAAKAWNLDVLAYSKIKTLPQEVKDKFISDMASNIHNKEAIQALMTKTIGNNLKSMGKELPITWFTPKIIKGLEAEKIRLQTPIVTFEDRQVKHSLGERKVEKQRLTEKQFLDLYSTLKKPDEIFLDLEDYAVVYVKFLPKNEITDGKNCIKIPVKINSNNIKRPVNYISTTGRINYNDTFLENKRYKKLK